MESNSPGLKLRQQPRRKLNLQQNQPTKINRRTDDSPKEQKKLNFARKKTGPGRV